MSTKNSKHLLKIICKSFSRLLEVPIAIPLEIGVGKYCVGSLRINCILFSGKGESIWDRWTHEYPEVIRDRSNGDVAAASYYNYRQDVQMLKALGVDFYRFSISWPRILPTGFANHINKDGIAYYNNLINELIKYNITPMATLYHWDLPQRLQDLGGWSNPHIVEYFADYARVVFKQFGDRVPIWTTFNEPMQTCLEGYGLPNRAPALNHHGVGEYLCTHYLLKSHARAYHIYDKEFRPKYNGKYYL